MKNNRLFNKTFILVTVLFTAFVVFASCSNATAPKKDNSDSQGIVVSGSFIFDGMTASGTSASRSAAPSYSELNLTDYYCVVQAYECEDVWMGTDGNGNDIFTKQKGAWSVASGSADMSTQKWNILIQYDGTYCIEVQLFIKDDNPDDDVPILVGESSMQEIVVDIDTISSHLNDTIAWPDAVMLYPNPGYTDKETTFYYVGKKYKRKYTEVPINLKFRYPTASNITAIHSGVSSFYFTYDTNDDTYNDVEFESVLAGDNGEITLVTITGVKQLNDIKQKNDYGAFYDPDPYQGSGEGLISFKDASGKTVYSCNETITLIPGFTTDTWYWDDENDPHYYKDSDGVTYFNITQEMLDNYKEKEIYQNYSGYNETNYSTLPVILFDKESSSYGHSVFNSIPENATLADGIEFAKNSKVLDFAIAPIDSNDNITQNSSNRNYYYSKTTQQVFTIEADGRGQKILVMYPTYAGYDSGEFIATVGDYNEEVLSVYAAYDGYIYLLLGTKNSEQGYIASVTAIKRVCVRQNETLGTRDSNFGAIQNFTFYKTVGGGDQQNVNIGDAIPFENTTVRGYKLTAYNYMNERSYMYLSYIYDSEKLYCKRITIPVNTNDETIRLNVTTGSSDIITYYMDLKTMTNESSYLKFSKAYVSDATIAFTESQIDTTSNGTVTIFNGDLYIAIHAPSGTFGGIVKISDIANESKSWSYTNADFCEKIGSDDNSPRIRGWYPPTKNDIPYSAEDEELYFYGPSKFIARKPDELVIADEKSYEYTEGGQNKGYNGDRVVKINLANFANPDSPMDVTPVSTKFSWQITVSCSSTGYVQY